MFDVKICGIRQTSEVDAISAVTAKPDFAGKGWTVAVGLNFYPRSVRHLDSRSSEATAISIAAAKAGLLRVGVFVNETAPTIAQVADHLGLAAIQLHGDETPDQVAAIFDAVDLPIIRAVKLRIPHSVNDPQADDPPANHPAQASLDAIVTACRPWQDLGYHLLLDADAGTQHGGSGKTLAWPPVGQWASTLSQEVTWTLAGGLTPQNVALAVARSSATSVDTASGVETTRGTKSPEKIQAFITNALGAIQISQASGPKKTEAAED